MPERAAYAKFDNPASRYAIVGVMVAKTAGGVRVAVTGAASSAFRWAEAEAALAANWSPDALKPLAASPELLFQQVATPPSCSALPSCMNPMSALAIRRPVDSTR